MDTHAQERLVYNLVRVITLGTSLFQYVFDKNDIGFKMTSMKQKKTPRNLGPIFQETPIVIYDVSITRRILLVLTLFNVLYPGTVGSEM
jgi:hypothetical protein